MRGAISPGHAQRLAVLRQRTGSARAASNCLIASIGRTAWRAVFEGCASPPYPCLRARSSASQSHKPPTSLTVHWPVELYQNASIDNYRTRRSTAPTAGATGLIGQSDQAPARPIGGPARVELELACC